MSDVLVVGVWVITHLLLWWPTFYHCRVWYTTMLTPGIILIQLIASLERGNVIASD